MSPVGLLGGTFDPIHIGHLLMAQAAYEALSLERVLFLPAGVPPHKRKQEREEAHWRLAMTRAAVAGDERFLVSTVDMDRPAPQFTVDTLAIIGRELGLSPDEIYFIMGSDSLSQFHTWHRPQLIAQECLLAVIARPGYEVALEAAYERVPELRGRVRLVDMPQIGVSSTLLRALARQGRSLRYWVPEAAERIIREQGLYRQAAPAPAGEAS